MCIDPNRENRFDEEDRCKMSCAFCLKRKINAISLFFSSSLVARMIDQSACGLCLPSFFLSFCSTCTLLTRRDVRRENKASRAVDIADGGEGKHRSRRCYFVYFFSFSPQQLVPRPLSGGRCSTNENALGAKEEDNYFSTKIGLYQR